MAPTFAPFALEEAASAASVHDASGKGTRTPEPNWTAMSSSSSPPAPPPSGYQSGFYGSGTQLPSINGEFVFFLLLWAVVGIVTLAADSVGPGEFVLSTVVLGAAYLISRGIAKAGKVFESA